MPTQRSYPRIKIAGRAGAHVAYLLMSETESLALPGSWSTPEVAFAAASAEVVNELAARAGTKSEDIAVAIVTPASAAVSPEPVAVTPGPLTGARNAMPVPFPTRCPECKRRVRRASEKASEWPGTVVMASRLGHCAKCKKQTDQRAAAVRFVVQTVLDEGLVADAKLLESLEPEPSKPKARKRRADAGKACVRAEGQNQENRNAARATAPPMIGPPPAFEEPRRSAVVPTAKPRPAAPPPQPKPPPVTVLGSGPITGPMDSFEQTLHTLDQFMARRHARGNRPTPTYIDRKVQA